MKKKILTVMLAGVMVAGMSAGSVQAATTEDASGDLYVFIAASLANVMDEIQKDFNEDPFQCRQFRHITDTDRRRFQM